jgi:hypothetical protein|tara:strand:- start:341 stop:706 length:366 start_codon:yes stop_codon:yes gene_type:complete
MQLQTIQNNSINNIIPSKIWVISKDNLLNIKYFQNMFEFSNNENDNSILLLKNIHDNEFQFIFDYINLYKNNIKLDTYISNLNNTDLLHFMKITDFFLIDDLLHILKKEFYNRLLNDSFNT